LPKATQPDITAQSIKPDLPTENQTDPPVSPEFAREENKEEEKQVLVEESGGGGGDTGVTTKLKTLDTVEREVKMGKSVSMAQLDNAGNLTP
jgi:hypothetical protein